MILTFSRDVIVGIKLGCQKIKPLLSRNYFFFKLKGAFYWARCRSAKNGMLTISGINSGNYTHCTAGSYMQYFI